MDGAEAAVAPRPGLDDVVGPEGGVDGRGRRGLGGAGQDRDEPDQGDADHQRRGGGRRAPGVALGVLPGQVAGGAGQLGGSAEEVHRRAGDDRTEHEHAEGGREHAEPEQLDGFGAGAGDTGGEGRPRRHRGWPRPSTVRRSDVVVLSMAVSRRAAIGAMRLALRAGPTDDSIVTVMPTAKAVVIVPLVMTTSPLGISRPTAASSASEAEGHQHAGAEADRPRPPHRRWRTRAAPTAAPGGGWRRRRGASPSPACAGR